jgi:hypothetical protein
LWAFERKTDLSVTKDRGFRPRRKGQTSSRSRHVVRAMVVTHRYGLSFPEPEGGIVTVVYPIMLSPGD